MKFSVIIPVYNVYTWLRRCVASVQAQTCKTLEIILVDDGSTDASGQLCDELATEDSRIRVIHKANGGLSDARNAGLQAATGDYVLFLDSDDFWLLPHGLERIEEALESNPTDLLLFKRVGLYPLNDNTLDSRDCIQRYGSDFIEDMFCTQNAQEVFLLLVQTQRFDMSACFQAIRRTLLTDNKIYFPVGLLSEDVDWSLRLWQYVQTIQALNLPMYGYWHRPGSITTTYSMRTLRCYDEMFSAWTARLPRLSGCYARAVAAYLAGLYVSCLYQYGQIDNACKKEAKAILRRHQTLLQYSLNKKAYRANFVHTFCGFGVMLWLFAGYGTLKRYLTKQKRILSETLARRKA